MTATMTDSAFLHWVAGRHKHVHAADVPHVTTRLRGIARRLPKGQATPVPDAPAPSPTPLDGSDAAFLHAVAGRLVGVHHESPDAAHVVRLRVLADALEPAQRTEPVAHGTGSPALGRFPFLEATAARLGYVDDIGGFLALAGGDAEAAAAMMVRARDLAAAGGADYVLRLESLKRQLAA